MLFSVLSHGQFMTKDLEHYTWIWKLWLELAKRLANGEAQGT